MRLAAQYREAAKPLLAIHHRAAALIDLQKHPVFNQPASDFPQTVLVDLETDEDLLALSSAQQAKLREQIEAELAGLGLGLN